MNRHPYSALFKPFDLSGEELAALENSIQANGVRNPITLYQGAILDGWNRYSAASRLGVNCPTEEFTGDDSEAWLFVVDENMRRRSLTEQQKVAIVLAKMQLEKEAEEASAPVDTPETEGESVDSPRNKPGESVDSPFGKKIIDKSSRELAREMDFSQGTATRIKRIADKGSDELIDAVQTGEISPYRAAEVLDKPKEEQLAAAKTKAAKPEMVPAETYAELKKQYEEATEREKDLAYSLEAYTAVEEGEQEKLIKRLRVEIDTLKCRLNTVTTERNEAIRQSAWWKSEAKRLGWTAPR